jgi:hypothetical protein
MYLVISILFDLLCHNKWHFFFLIINLMAAKGSYKILCAYGIRDHPARWASMRWKEFISLFAPYRFISANLASVGNLFSPIQHSTFTHTHAIFCTHPFDFLCDSLTAYLVVFLLLLLCTFLVFIVV